MALLTRPLKSDYRFDRTSFFNEDRPWKLGSDLTPAEQSYVLSAFVHRFTLDHVPGWARKPRIDGSPYPVQFKSDAEWLANTKFQVHGTNLRLDRKCGDCRSTPTWPYGHNPGDIQPIWPTITFAKYS